MITKIQNNSVNHRGKLLIKPEKNTHIPYLFNKLLPIVKENQVTAVFKRDIVEISGASNQQEAVEKGLKALNVNYADSSKKNSILDKAYEIMGNFVEQH